METDYLNLDNIETGSLGVSNTETQLLGRANTKKPTRDDKKKSFTFKDIESHLPFVGNIKLIHYTRINLHKHSLVLDGTESLS